MWPANRWAVLQVVLATLACPKLPLAPILAIEKRKSHGSVEEPASVYKPLEELGTAGTAGSTGCLFEAVQGLGAYQAALNGNGESMCPCGA